MYIVCVCEYVYMFECVWVNFIFGTYATEGFVVNNFPWMKKEFRVKLVTKKKHFSHIPFFIYFFFLHTV